MKKNSAKTIPIKTLKELTDYCKNLGLDRCNKKVGKEFKCTLRAKELCTGGILTPLPKNSAETLQNIILYNRKIKLEKLLK